VYLDVGRTKTHHIIKVIFVDLTVGNIEAENAVENGNVNQNEINLHTDIKQLLILYIGLVDTEAVENIAKSLLL